MFRQKLQALEYHSADSIDIGNPLDLKAAVVWLEDQKIRHYKMEERADLRNNTGENWTTSFTKYLRDLECPYDPTTRLPAVFDWLLGVAVRYDFGEASEVNPELKRGLEMEKTPTVTKAGLHSPSTPAKSPLDIDPRDATFGSGVQALAKILKVVSHPDPSVLLEAVKIVIEEKVSEAAVDAAGTPEVEDGVARVAKKKRKFLVTPLECGFDLGVPALDEAAKVLRLLHIQELRHLQTHINELIVSVQTITANPKTDQSLGKVGR